MKVWISSYIFCSQVLQIFDYFQNCTSIFIERNNERLQFEVSSIYFLIKKKAWNTIIITCLYKIEKNSRFIHWTKKNCADSEAAFL